MNHIASKPDTFKRDSGKELGRSQKHWSMLVAVATWLTALPLLTSGCATNALWNKAQLDAWNEPAANSKLQLFDASQQKDFLVVYEEYSERHDSTRTRAYFLNQNEMRVEQGRKPHFVSAQLSRELPPIPVWETLPLANTNFPPTVYAVISTNKQSFTIYSNEQGTNHDLPVYNDGWGRTDRIALTPVAVVADLTIIGGCLWIYFGGPGLKSNQ
jgi:hypothetical protein